MTDTSPEIQTIQEYLEQLREALAGCDPALVQDALYDAEEYLRSKSTDAAAGAAAEYGPMALRHAIQTFGTPREVAEAYLARDAGVAAALAPPAPPAGSVWHRIFGVLLDPRAYGALLFMLLSLVTGILFFVWTVTGVALSIGLSVLVIGLPFFLVFLASVRLLALLEGRLVESLLGVRMPRRPQLPLPPGSFWGRIGARLSDRRTWTTLLYMILKLPMGIFTFTLFISLLSICLALLAAPVAQAFFDEPFLRIGGADYFVTPWAMPIFWAAGLIDLLVVMHLARALGRVQGALLKAMLVSG
jgi:uncharacterized membrane protein